MEIKAFSNRLKMAGVELAGIEYWTSCLVDHQKAKWDFETIAYLEHPFNWYNPKVLTFVRQMPMPEETRAYMYMAILSKLIPDPSEITTWPEMKARILEIENITGFIHKTDLILPTNRDFLTKFEQRSPCSLEEWNLEVLRGNVWGILAAAVRQLRHLGPTFIEWREPYMSLLAILITPVPQPDFKIPDEQGLLILTSHCRFNVEHAKQTKLHLRHRVFIMGRHLANDDTKRNAVPMLMYKTLKSGNAVYAAIDGGFGNLNIKGAVFGCEVALPGSFIWAASKTGPDCQWRYLVASEEGAGTIVQADDFILSKSQSESYEDFCEAFLPELSRLIEKSMLDKPFSFGSYQNIRQRLRTA